MCKMNFLVFFFFQSLLKPNSKAQDQNKELTAEIIPEVKSNFVPSHTRLKIFKTDFKSIYHIPS